MSCCFLVPASSQSSSTTAALPKRPVTSIFCFSYSLRDYARGDQTCIVWRTTLYHTTRGRVKMEIGRMSQESDRAGDSWRTLIHTCPALNIGDSALVR